MGKFLRALAKVGLVELESGDVTPAEAMSEEEARRIVRDAQPAADPPTAPEPPAPPLPPPSSDAGIEEGRPFDAIYAEAQLRPIPFPAEKLLKLLDGLRAMDAGTRRTAILAMDAADDTWTIGDPVHDAERKAEALGRAQAGLRAAQAAAEAKFQQEVAALDKYSIDATTAIREQITALEQRLQTEVESVTKDKVNAEAKLRATREAVARETARLALEIDRLSEVPKVFGGAVEKGQK